MAKILKAQSEAGFDYINFNSEYDEDKLITIRSNQISVPYNLKDYLSVGLINRKSRVVMQGQLSFIVSGTETISRSSIIIGVQVYRDEERTNMAYQTYMKIAGISIDAAQGANFIIPIQFVEKTTLKITEDNAKYYITIQVKPSQINESDELMISLQQYSIFVMELCYE